MITVKTLKTLLNGLPDEATLYAYADEDTGITIIMPDGSYKFIRADDDQQIDHYTEGFKKAS